MPQELLEIVFSDLSKYDLQALSSVSKSMRERVLEVANVNEPLSIRNFIKSIIQNLDEQLYSGQIELLVGIKKNIHIHQFKDLLQLKGYILDLKQQLIDVIKTLDEDFFNLDVQLPHFMEDIFELARFEKRIDNTYLIPNEYHRSSAFDYISKALTSAGNIDRALEIAGLITKGYVKDGAFIDIAISLTSAGNIDRALEIAGLITTKISRSDAFGIISRALTSAGNFDRALEIARLISDQCGRSGAFGIISIALASARNIDRAIEIAGLISDEYHRSRAFSVISSALNSAGNNERSSKKAGLIPNRNHRSSAANISVKDLILDIDP